MCTLDCVYCECGATTERTRVRREYVPLEEVFGELRDFFSSHPDPDYITFSGAGEPTLHARLGRWSPSSSSFVPAFPWPC
ncbi:MAG: hypothetical protein R2751_18820 [Bacteroidales bacterium]